MIPRPERHGNQIPAEPRFSLADLIERRFHVMGERSGCFETEHGARTLDSVQRAEGGIDQACIIGGAVEVEQHCFQLGEKFLRFLLEDIDGICRAHSPRTFLATATSCSG